MIWVFVCYFFTKTGKHIFLASPFCLWGLPFLHHWLQVFVEMSYILWCWGWEYYGLAQWFSKLQHFHGIINSQTEIIAVIHKLLLALKNMPKPTIKISKEKKISLCQLIGCSLSPKPKITMAPYFSAFIWTEMGSFLHSLFSCLTASFLVNYVFQARKQCIRAHLKPLKCFSSTFQSWRCKKYHPK